MSTLERAIAIAAEAHAGQTDKGGTAAYVLHPIRVMLKMKTDDARITAVLHDVVEDCSGWTLDRLRSEGFSETVILAVDSVTKKKGEPYPDQVFRAAGNPIGRLVKYADMIDNSDITRIANPTEVDFVRLEKYKNGIAEIDALNRPTEFTPMPLDDIAEDGLLKMLRARKTRKAPPTTWSFSIWERRPAVWSPGFAFSLKDGTWVPVNSSEVGMEGRSTSKDALEAQFGALPESPPFPLQEIRAALPKPTPGRAG